ncbi:Retrovirus-related Gag polyprotein [Cricetulus griseus]|uniref:human endogenous retrovirus K endopeptidase n=1 Tax=Cricetulus griseus TaxID=10029 RepID=G3IB83_CRIGR|nr:Retrovirus-related Gag polyprotein [Cricetulus griseus]
MLLGLGPYSNQQTGYPVQLFDQINQIAIRAWKSIPNKWEVSGNLTKIVQGPMEPFSDFVARVLEAADYTGVVKIMVESPKGITAISPGDKIAQLILLPSLHQHFTAKDRERGESGFGSTGMDLAFLSLDLDQRPVLELNINGKRVLGVLDTGADRSIIAKKDCPAGWPVQVSSQTLQGLGYAKAPDMSARQLQWKDGEGHSGVMQPYVLELPVSLWGRDLLRDMGFKLSNEYSPTSQKMMKDMGYHPDYGLGKYLQGRKEPVQTRQRNPRLGLGFS